MPDYQWEGDSGSGPYILAVSAVKSGFARWPPLQIPTNRNASARPAAVAAVPARDRAIRRLPFGMPRVRFGALPHPRSSLTRRFTAQVTHEGATYETTDSLNAWTFPRSA